jgi:hypothetical protein
VPLAGGALETGVNYLVYSSTLNYLTRRCSRCECTGIASATHDDLEPGVSNLSHNGGCSLKPELEAADYRQALAGAAYPPNPASNECKSACAERSFRAESLSNAQQTQTSGRMHQQDSGSGDLTRSSKVAADCPSLPSAQCGTHVVGSDGCAEAACHSGAGHISMQQHLAHLAAGAVAGVALSFVLSPVELIKCRLQVLRECQYTPQKYCSLHLEFCTIFFLDVT